MNLFKWLLIMGGATGTLVLGGNFIFAASDVDEDEEPVLIEAVSTPDAGKARRQPSWTKKRKRTSGRSISFQNRERVENQPSNPIINRQPTKAEAPKEKDDWFNKQYNSAEQQEVAAEKLKYFRSDRDYQEEPEEQAELVE